MLKDGILCTLQKTMSQESLKSELEQRGFLYQYSDEKVFALYEKGGQTLYIGVDPTADSIHLGTMAALMHAVTYMKRGNKLILIVGGATGMVGDPWGKDSERVFLDEKTLSHNVQAIASQMKAFFDHLKQLSGYEFEYEVINNIDFYQDKSYIDFLRDVGKYITVNQMMNKETVKKRIEDPSKSISYTEFSYMLMQGFDFLCLYQQHNCKLQLGASDQWGNIITWVELIRKKLDQEAFAITCPLILDASGKKFGKSEGNAIWLDPAKSSPYSVYQYFLNTADEDVERFLKLLTLLDFGEVQEIVSKHQQDTAQRYGQTQLAKYVTTTIFGETTTEQAEKITRILFGAENPIDLIQKEMTDASDLQALYQAAGGASIVKDLFPQRLIDLCTQTGLTESNGEAKKQIQAGAIYVNEEKITDITYEVRSKDRINERVILLRKGKKNYKVIRLP